MSLLYFFINAYALGQPTILQKEKTIFPQKQSKFSSDTIFLKQIDSNVRSSNEFDWKTWLPVFTSLVVLVVTNIVTLYKIRMDTQESLKKEIIISKIKIERERLEKFYDPIYTAVRCNSSIFDSYGPQTFPRDGGVLETEASQVWRQLTENVVIPNNRKICNVIQQFSHLIGTNDNLNNYLEYLVHSESFEHFIKWPNSIHKSFKYPVGFATHVESVRSKMLTELRTTENKLLSNGSEIHG